MRNPGSAAAFTIMRLAIPAGGAYNAWIPDLAALARDNGIFTQPG